LSPELQLLTRKSLVAASYGNTTHMEYRSCWSCYNGWEVCL